MSTITRSDFQRIVLSSAGALLVSAAFVTAAVRPAHAATPNAPLTVGDWQSQVSHQLDTAMRAPAFSPRGSGIGAATVTAHFDADGHFSGATLRKSSGSQAIDQAALATARTLAYPTFPDGLRGAPQTITLYLNYGVAADSRDAANQARQFERSVRRDEHKKTVQTAALSRG